METQVVVPQRERGVGHTDGKVGERREGLDIGNGVEPTQTGSYVCCTPEDGWAANKTLGEEGLRDSQQRTKITGSHDS